MSCDTFSWYSFKLLLRLLLLSYYLTKIIFRHFESNPNRWEKIKLNKNDKINWGKNSDEENTLEYFEIFNTNFIL